MDDYLLRRMRTEAKAIFRESLRPVNPYGAVKNFVRLKDDQLILGVNAKSRTTIDLTQFDRIWIVGGGKATAPMAKANNKDLTFPSYPAVGQRYFANPLQG